MLFFFFYERKKAYELRIRYWSSDVCSSDLRPRAGDRGQQVGRAERLPAQADRVAAGAQAVLRRMGRGGTHVRAAWFRPARAVQGRASRPCLESERASRRGRVCQYVSLSLVGLTLYK